MVKKFLLLNLLILFIACSNSYVHKEFFEKNIDVLNEFNLDIKKNLSKNNFIFLKENSVENIKNKYVLNQIEKLDFSNIDIFISKINFNEKYPKSIVGFSTYDNTFYFELTYVYDYRGARWLIYEVKEKGENSDFK